MTYGYIYNLTSKGLIRPPSFLPEAVQYEVVMGSMAYGVSSDSSDMDLYGWCVPDKDVIFPHLRGEIDGFGKRLQRFEQYEQHHVADPSAQGGRGRTYDIQIFNIVKYFTLVMQNNPNMIDSLFVPVSCVLYQTPLGQMVRENRKLFLHKGSWHRFKGYAFQQLSKMKTKEFKDSPKRREEIEKYGYCTKFAYHIIRLMDEAEQILTEGDIDLQRNREQLKAIRRGEWTLEQVESHFNFKERQLEEVYQSSTLQKFPPEGKIKQLLLDCLEQHFGTLEGCVQTVDPAVQAIQKIEQAIQDYRRCQT